MIQKSPLKSKKNRALNDGGEKAVMKKTRRECSGSTLHKNKGLEAGTSWCGQHGWGRVEIMSEK